MSDMAMLGELMKDAERVYGENPTVMVDRHGEQTTVRIWRSGEWHGEASVSPWPRLHVRCTSYVDAVCAACRALESMPSQETP